MLPDARALLMLGSGAVWEPADGFPQTKICPHFLCHPSTGADVILELIAIRPGCLSVG